MAIVGSAQFFFTPGNARRTKKSIIDFYFSEYRRVCPMNTQFQNIF